MPEAASLVRRGVVRGVKFERYAFPHRESCSVCGTASRGGVRIEDSYAYNPCCPRCWRKAKSGFAISGRRLEYEKMARLVTKNLSATELAYLATMLDEDVNHTFNECVQEIAEEIAPHLFADTSDEALRAVVIAKDITLSKLSALERELDEVRSGKSR